MSALPLGMITQQGATSKAWTAPDLQVRKGVPIFSLAQLSQSPLSLQHIVEHHFRCSADHVHATTPAGRSVSTREFLRAAHRAGRELLRSIEEHAENRIVGILAEPEAFLASATALGAICAGLIPLMLSTRNSSAAIADLCEKTKCRVIFCSKESAALSKLATAAQSQLKDSGVELKVLPMPAFDVVYPRFAQEQASDPFEPLLLPEIASLDAPLLILHSSGSTGFPKPIVWSHRFAIRANSWPWYGNKDICGRSWFVGATPTFHMAGVSNHILVPLLTGVSLVLFDPKEKAWPPTPELVIDAVARTRPKDLSVVPSYLEAWAEEKESIAILRRIERLIYGGGPLSHEVGNKLVDAGVTLSQIYGSTEVGVTNELLDKPSKDWMWLRKSPQLTLRLQPVEGDDQTCVLQSSERHETAVRNLGDEAGFDTNDLVRRHPTDSDLLQIVGRADSQIMLANGEKTSPESMEHLIELHSLVDRAVMFGRGRLSCGILIQPASAHIDMNRNELLKQIWPTIEQANRSAPQHSRLFKTHIVFADSSRPFELTAKNTVRRHKVLEAYADDIERVYAEPASSGEASPANGLDLAALVSQVVKEVLQMPKICEDEDLFTLGCDSLQATFIQTRLASATGRKLPANLVYLAPTVAKLQTRLAVQQQAISTTEQALLEKLAHVRAMEEAIERHARGLSQHQQDAERHINGFSNGHIGETVLVTGTTGALGSQLLASLLEDVNVAHIFALNRRAKGTTLVARQKEAFVSRRIDPSALDSHRLSLVEADLSQKDLGLASETIQVIRQSATIMILNAWRVNFKHPLSGFEDDLIGLRHLLDVASSCNLRPHFVFTSSIASLASWPTDTFGPERLPDHAILAVGQGYGESKYVAEKVVARYSAMTGMPSTVVRVGQLCGARSTGAWATSEWLPALVKSSETLHCLPSGQDCIAWVPIDEAANAILDMSLDTQPGFRCLNVAHPRPVAWSAVIEPIAGVLHVPLVPYDKWLSKLEASATDEEHDLNSNPALLLLDMFKHSCVSNQPRAAQEALDMPRLETTRSQEVSKTLRDLAPLTTDDAMRWVQYWRDTGFLARPSLGK